MKIAIDFDGTCVTHEFPKIGINIGAEYVLRDLVCAGHKLILFTMRSDMEVSELDINIEGKKALTGKYLTDALSWFSNHEIDLYSVQKDINQELWTSSNKCYAELYIDDAALGVPLIYPEIGRPYVDWLKVRVLLVSNGILNN